MRHFYLLAPAALMVACSSAAPAPENESPAPEPPADDGAKEPPEEPTECQLIEVDVPLQMPWMHWPEGEPIHYDHNPPAGGQSYEMWAAYRRYDEPVSRGHWNHNLKHGAIVMIYRPDAPAEVVSVLEQALEHIPTPNGKYGAPADCPRMGLLTPDPELDDETFAVLAWGKMLTSNCVPTVEDIVDFAERHIFEAPEKECYNGA